MPKEKPLGAVSHSQLFTGKLMLELSLFLAVSINRNSYLQKREMSSRFRTSARNSDNERDTVMEIIHNEKLPVDLTP